MVELTKEQQLLYDIIFSETVDFEIKILDYIEDSYLIENFTDKIMKCLLLSGIKVIEQVYILTKEKKSWVLKIKR